MTPQELTKIRETLNLTKKDLASKLGTTAMLVGKYEKGSAPIPETIIKSLEALMGAESATPAVDEAIATPVEETVAEEVVVDENQPVEAKISDFVKNLRLTMNLSQKAFGELLGVSGASVGFYENGRNEPKDVILEKLKELEASLPTGAVSVPEADEEKATPVVEENIIVSAPADAEVTVAKETTTTKKTKAKKADKKETTTKANKKTTRLFIQSNAGGSITPEDVMKKVPEGVDEIYVKPEENKAYWVKGSESGSVELW